MSLFNWINFLGPKKRNKKKQQQFVSIKRTAIDVEFIYPGHPLYDNIVNKEENLLRILAPNETEYNETSLIHNFAAIIKHNNNNFLVINSTRHFKEQTIGGLLQFDENIYNVVPFHEDETEYQTANAYTFSETYECDHPVEIYGFTAERNHNVISISLERGKKAISIKMIDEIRSTFTSKLPEDYIELIDYIVLPAVEQYDKIQEQIKQRAS